MGESLVTDARYLFNKAGKRMGDKGKIILVLLIRAMLLVQGEILQVDRQELLNATTAKVKDIWLGNALSLSDQGILHCIKRKQSQTIIPHNVAFQTADLDAYDSDFDDLSTAQAVLMANISNYVFDIISKVPNSETYLNDIDNQSVQALQDFEQIPVMDFTDNEISRNGNKEQNNESITAEFERYKERVKTFEQRLNIDLSSHEKMIDSQMDNMIREKLALKEQIDSLKQNLSKQIKEKESLFKKFSVCKNESNDKENKYMENEIDLEKNTKELHNIICYQNPFDLKKAQRIKPTLYDGVVLSNTHIVMPVIDDEETLILEEESRSKILIEDIETRSQHQELSAEQAFWFHDDLSYIELLLTTFRSVDVSSELLKKRTTPSALEEEYFEINDLKACLQDKDKTISKLKDTIKSLKKNTKEKNVHHDKCDLEPINEELENNQFDSIKQTRVRHKEQCDSLINKLNLKYAKNEDLKAQIQDKVFVITSLKNDLRKSKGKEIVENVVHIPSATTIAPSIFKLDLVSLPHRLLQNREVHINYLRNTQEQATHSLGIELLVYVQNTYPNAITPSTKKVAVTPMNNVKKARLAEPLTSLSNIKQVESSNTSDSNTPVLSSIGVKCSTSILRIKASMI
ncbi:hypothetical protein Tco_1115134 [Tanacetum coccineum]